MSLTKSLPLSFAEPVRIQNQGTEAANTWCEAMQSSHSTYKETVSLDAVVMAGRITNSLGGEKLVRNCFVWPKR